MNRMQARLGHGSSIRLPQTLAATLFEDGRIDHVARLYRQGGNDQMARNILASKNNIFLSLYFCLRMMTIKFLYLKDFPGKRGSSGGACSDPSWRGW